MVSVARTLKAVEENNGPVDKAKLPPLPVRSGPIGIFVMCSRNWYFTLGSELAMMTSALSPGQMEAALPVAIAAEHVDLDGPIWLAADSSPFPTYAQGRIRL